MPPCECGCGEEANKRFVRGHHNRKPERDRTIALLHARGCPEEYSDEELLAHLRALADDMGRTPTSAEVIKASPPSHSHYYRRWGSFRAACEAAGLKSYGTGGAGHRDRSAA